MGRRWGETSPMARAPEQPCWPVADTRPAAVYPRCSGSGRIDMMPPCTLCAFSLPSSFPIRFVITWLESRMP